MAKPLLDDDLWILDSDRTDFAQAQTSTQTVSRAQADLQPPGAQRDSVRAQDRHRLGVSAAGDGMRIGHDLLASPARFAAPRHLDQAASSAAGQASRGRQNRLVAGGGRQHVGACGFWGAQTGPNPTDRRKNGSKHHLLTDGNGIPMAVTLTGANRHDVTQLLPLVESVPPGAGKPGRPRRRFDCTQGHPTYPSNPHRATLRRPKTRPVLARRFTPHGSGLGVYRWVVERTESWLHQNRRLKIRYERRADIHLA